MLSSLKVVGLLLVCGSVGRSQQTVVAGMVVDRATRAPLAKISVELIATTGDAVVDTAVTERDGVFSLAAPRAGAYRVRFNLAASTHVSDSLVVADGDYLTREFVLDPTQRDYSEIEVDKPVLPARGSISPYYPDVMRNQGIDGCVLATFIVDTTGRADRGTLRILKYSHREFVRAVWDALPRMRFVPAELRGHKVPQKVSQPFNFSILGHDGLDLCVTPAKAPSKR